MSAETLDVQVRLKELESLVEIGRVINSTMNLDEVFAIALEKTKTIMRAEAASLFLLEDPGDELLVVSACGGASEQLKRIRIPADKGIVGSVVKEGHTLVVPDVSQDGRFYGVLDKNTQFQTRSILCAPLRIKGQVIGAIEAVNRLGEEGDSFSELDRPLIEAFAEEVSVGIHNAQLFVKVEETFINAIAALAEAVDARDPYTAGHSRRVTYYADAIARELQLEESHRNQIHVSALLHDIGKIGVPDSILNKTSRLTQEEYDWMKTHPLIGYDILKSLFRFRPLVLLGLKHHHERYDGAGYPDKLWGEQIPLVARILSVADAFDAMVSSRAYRQAIGEERAVAEISDNAGMQFDPSIAEAFLKGLSEGRIALLGNQDLKPDRL